MAALTWTWETPMKPGWYWYRGSGETDPFIVEVDESGCFQWPDGGYQEAKLAKGQWAGPIPPPEES
ncbi:MAG: hypothetical protein AB1411_07415 [Nitrospirota bacterium]